MSNGKSNTRMIMLTSLLVGIMLGAALVLAFSSSNINPRSEHFTLAASVTVYDNTLSKEYIPVCVRSGFTVPLSVLPLEFSGAIDFSMWEFRSDPDDPTTAYAVMSVYGPGSDGEHFLQIGRLTADSLTIKYPSGPTGGITWPAGGNAGYMYVIV